MTNQQIAADYYLNDGMVRDALSYERSQRYGEDQQPDAATICDCGHPYHTSAPGGRHTTDGCPNYAEQGHGGLCVPCTYGCGVS